MDPWSIIYHERGKSNILYCAPFAGNMPPTNYSFMMPNCQWLVLKKKKGGLAQNINALLVRSICILSIHKPVFPTYLTTSSRGSVFEKILDNKSFNESVITLSRNFFSFPVQKGDWSGSNHKINNSFVDYVQLLCWVAS